MPLLYPGPLAVIVIHTRKGVDTMVTKEKWQKTRDLVLELGTLMQTRKLSHKRLEKIWGFLIHVYQTFR